MTDGLMHEEERRLHKVQGGTIRSSHAPLLFLVQPSRFLPRPFALLARPFLAFPHFERSDSQFWTQATLGAAAAGLTLGCDCR